MLPSMPSSIPSKAGENVLEVFFFISDLGLLVFFFFFLPEEQHPQHHLGKQLHVLLGGFFAFGASKP